MAVRVPTGDGRADALPADDLLVLEECMVVRWRGYTRSTFVACLADGTAVAESASVKWRDGATAHEGAPGDALAALCRELESLGWTRTGQGEEWYEVRYGRWVTAPEPEPADESGEDTRVAGELPPPLPVHIVREPEPASLPAPPPPPPPAPAPMTAAAAPALHAAAPVSEPAAPRRRRTIVLVSLLGILAALGLGAYIAKRGHAAPIRTVQLVSLAPKRQTPAAKPSVAKAAAAPAAAAKPAAPRPLRLVIANTGHASWLEVRRGSSGGPVLYSGVVEPGRTMGYSGATLWVRFAAAANFRISIDGRPVAVQGTVDRVFSSKR